MSKQYGCLPSAILGIEDGYTAFCFDEACCAYMLHLQNGEKPRYKDNLVQDKNGELKPKSYSSFTELYKNYGG